ncbi:MAG: cadherin-like beta sandwich domain-containing protein [Planctomycetota bacterium]|jgi:hypothetical protein
MLRASLALCFAILVPACGGDGDNLGGQNNDSGDGGGNGGPAASTNADLGGLELSGPGLNEPFDTKTTDYTAATRFLEGSLTLTATVSDAAATVTVDGVAVASGAPVRVALAEGSNTIAVEVTAEDGVTRRTYTVVATRATAASFAQEAFVKASNTREDAQFGRVLALDGDTLAVGAEYESSKATGVNGDQSNTDAPGAGAVYVFTRDASGTWSQQAYLKASNAEEGDRFGTSLALHGDTLVVGAPNGRAAYVFVRDTGGAWSQQAILTEAPSSSFFGAAVAVHGDTIAVGARLEDFSRGAVYVFTRDGSGAWSRQDRFEGLDRDDWFGVAVALEGDTLAVGAVGEDSNATGVDGDEADNGAGWAGAAYVYVRDAGGAWSRQAYLKASNTDGNDFFGASVALSGDTLAVGAPFEASDATGVDGDEGNDDEPQAGAVYLFARDASGTWSQQAYLKASNTNGGDELGIDMALEGDVLAIGAWAESGGATGVNGDQTNPVLGQTGAVYVFLRDAGGAWSQQAYVKASTIDAGDSFGFSVALSGDTLAVGAFGESSKATGIDGDQADDSADNAGAAYVRR